MKDFLKGYKEAHAKAREYMRAERAGWDRGGREKRLQNEGDQPGRPREVRQNHER